MMFPKRATFSTSLQAKEGVASAGELCVFVLLLLAILLGLMKTIPPILLAQP